jgi:hypothetical protein
MAGATPKNGGKKKRVDDTAQDEIFEAPTILREPTSRQIFLGHKLVLRITATGKPLPSFQWYLNGKKIAGANSDRITVMKTRRDHAGSYTCEAKNHAGKVMSRAAMVTFLVERVPELIVEPGIASIPHGKPFEFRLTNVDANQAKRLQIQWMFNGKRIRSAQGTKLTFTEVKPKYEGEYKAVIVLGGEIYSSNCVRLVVVAATGATVESPSKLIPMPTAPIAQPPPYEELFFNPEEEPMDASIMDIESTFEPDPNMPVAAEPVLELPNLDMAPNLESKRERLERMLNFFQKIQSKNIRPIGKSRTPKAAA